MYCAFCLLCFQFQNFQPMPIMRSDSSCEMSVDHKVYNKIVCQELHLFQPFSSKDSGAQTIIKQMLTLLTESNSTSEMPGNFIIQETWISWFL